MKKIIGGLVLAMSLAAIGTQASAANIVETQAITFSNDTSDFGASFGQAAAGSTFTENFTFNYGNTFDVTSAVISIALKNMSALNITSFTLSGNGTTSTGTKTVIGSTQFFGLEATNLAAGLYTLTVSGLVTGSSGGSFGGNINIAPVPEASTVAMMLGGLSLVGFAAMRRRKQAGEQAQRFAMA